MLTPTYNPMNVTPNYGVSSLVRPLGKAERLKFAQPVARIYRPFYGLGAISPSAISMIANTVESQEGYRPGTIAYRNNNPGNLMYAGQTGATLGEGGFAYFPDYETGRAALEIQIGLYAGRGLTIQGMAEKYAPWGHGANNPDVYASRIASALGVSTGTPLSALDSSTGSVASLMGGGSGSSTWLDDNMQLLAIGAVSLFGVIWAFGD